MTENGYARLSPTCKEKVRQIIASYTLRAEANQDVWHYSRARPFRGYATPPDRWHSNDCSGYVSLVYAWAMHWTHCYLADPLGFDYTGKGYTGTLLTWLKAHGSHVEPSRQKLLVGDIALYGDPYAESGHTALVRLPGSQSLAWLSSNGSEAGPLKVRLNYRDDLVGVWRHPALR